MDDCDGIASCWDTSVPKLTDDFVGGSIAKEAEGTTSPLDITSAGAGLIEVIFTFRETGKIVCETLGLSGSFETGLSDSESGT
jgi:hypothetical protein